MSELFKELLISYGLIPDHYVVKNFGQGHIHETFLVDPINMESPPLILQRINTQVFKNVDMLMHNLELVCAHIAYKNRKSGLDPAKSGILLLEAEEGKSYIGSEKAGFWRMFWYIQKQQSFDIAPDTNIAYEGGRAISNFQSLLLDLGADLIKDTIPDFHNLRFRYSQFEEALGNAKKVKLEKASELIASSQMNFLRIVRILERSEEGNVPLRICHNDTKFNNILFNEEARATCMIDLDTVMKGYSWFDFGDALRTCASSADEEEKDLNNIELKMDVFKAFTEGYLSIAIGYLNKEEIDMLHLAPSYFSYMQGLRFLTDFLNGNFYYKTKFPDDNYFRAAAQYRLLEHMSKAENKMREIVQSIAAYS
jgi:hypothetical protein